MKELITILSLVVAALAVFIGPLISWFIAKRQIDSSLEVANKHITAPMRQAWINNLRDALAELTSRALHYYLAGFEEREDAEHQNLTLLEHKVILMLNPNEEDHKQLEILIRQMTSSLSRGREGDEDFCRAHTDVMALSRRIIKREWNRVKERIKITKPT